MKFYFPSQNVSTIHPPTVQVPSLVGLPPGIIDISAPGYNARALLGAQAAKNCRALQFTNQANFDNGFHTDLLETYKIHNSIRKDILSNFVSVELEQGERLGGEPFYMPQTHKGLCPDYTRFTRQSHSPFAIITLR